MHMDGHTHEVGVRSVGPTKSARTHAHYGHTTTRTHITYQPNIIIFVFLQRLGHKLVKDWHLRVSHIDDAHEERKGDVHQHLHGIGVLGMPCHNQAHTGWTEPTTVNNQKTEWNACTNALASVYSHQCIPEHNTADKCLNKGSVNREGKIKGGSGGGNG
jgi:hypothetical protein